MSLLLTYLLILLAVFLLQRKMMYFPARFSRAQQDELMADLKLQPWPPGGERRGMISQMSLGDAKGTVLVFHGNAGAALHRAYYIDALQSLGYRVIIAEYPGYGARSGSPSEAALVEDGIATAKIARQAFKEPLFLCGESLGSGVVAGIIASHEVPIKGLLLITPFDSMVRVAQHHYWFLLARWLILDKFDNVAKFRDFTGRIAVIMAGQDEVIPNRRTLALFEALPEQRKKLWRFENAGHNSLPLEPWRPWWREAMEFIDR
ncbi:alpha/beta hydrolase [Methylomicrobium sp. Wu6]|uniref:alpha/beta hydrolase n=1 Tax=Methylomicrobium sp. Wu6 TaxID=3107928 RepID=UPI002DD64311|nr:alpha/beta hydrolase [Methylomicrobium sp. Wu6]